MSSIRISDFIRRRIFAELLTKFNDTDDWLKLIGDSATLANDCYELFQGDDLAAINRIKDGWLPEKDAILVYFGESTENNTKLHFNGLSRFMPTIDFLPSRIDDRKKRFKFTDFHNQEPIRIKKKDALCKEFFRISSEGVRLEKARGEIEQQISSALAAANTTKQLFEMWPEVQPIVSGMFTQATPNNLPVPQMGALNAKLGLSKAA